MQKLLDDGYSRPGGSLADMIMQLSNIAVDMEKTMESYDVNHLPGIQVWLNTLRCLAHSELQTYGIEIWRSLSEGIANIEIGIQEIRERMDVERDTLAAIRSNASYVPPAFRAQ